MINKGWLGIIAIVVIIILIILGYFYFINAKSMNNNPDNTSCIGDGQIKATMNGINGVCCPGLYIILSGYKDGITYCTSELCGNSKCLGKENSFNCPKDC